jgi:mono/diheme cytochrome c family protein
VLPFARRFAPLGLSLAFAALTAACVSAAPAGGQAYADENGDPVRGLTYAQDHCSSCHGVRADDAASPIANAPRFQDVANTPGFTRIALNAWLHTSHPNMPNLIVESGRVDDIYAYLRTLKTRR